MQGGGEHLHHGVKLLLEKHSPAAYMWSKNKVAFGSSMVDRVSPATNDQLREQVASQLNIIDNSPVAAESFSQWVIEDNFAGVKPPFDKAGAIFVDNITPYENMKLRFLNAGHSMAAVLGYLIGDEFIHQALSRKPILTFVEQALIENVLPVTDIPKGFDGLTYIQQVLRRFKNHALPYSVLQVGAIVPKKFNSVGSNYR